MKYLHSSFPLEKLDGFELWQRPVMFLNFMITQGSPLRETGFAQIAFERFHILHVGVHRDPTQCYGIHIFKA